jgi:NTP pyrophosphatase (non-canonical NTP hydrolase)
MEIGDFQRIIYETYHRRDADRGKERTFMWFVEEVGELARAIRDGDRERIEDEFGDVFAWLISVANLYGINMGEAIRKYIDGCPRCGRSPCRCKGG